MKSHTIDAEFALQMLICTCRTVEEVMLTEGEQNDLIS